MQRIIDVLHRARIVQTEQVERSRTIAHGLIVRMGGDADHTATIEAGKVVVLELLGHVPGDEVSGVLDALLELAADDLSGEASLQRDLDDGEDLGELVLGAVDGAEE